MADVHHRRKNGIYHVRVRWQDHQYERSLHTRVQREADDLVAVIRQTVLAVDRGHLIIPEGVDPLAFFVSGGRLQPSSNEQSETSDLAPQPPTVREAAEGYFASFPPNSKETDTVRTERTHVKHLTRLLGNRKPMASIQRADLQSYVNRRASEPGLRGKVQRKTIKMELDTFRQIWNWAAGVAMVRGTCPLHNDQGKLAVNLPKGREKEPFRTWDEIQTILAVKVSPEREAELWESLFLDIAQVHELLTFVREVARHPWIYPMFCFAAFTGARISEICRAKVEDVLFDSQKILIREKKKSQHKYTTRTVPLAPPLAEALRAWLAHHPGGPLLFYKPAHVQKSKQQSIPLSRLAAEKHFKLTLQGGKWAKLHGWHLFRHSFASNLARSGKVSQAVVDELLGHQTEEMRKRYRHLFPGERQNAVHILSELYAAPTEQTKEAQGSQEGK